MSAPTASDPEPERRASRLPVLEALGDLARVVECAPDLYVRWSLGPDVDLWSTSIDRLTGVQLPGLSASPLRVEPWWGERPKDVWLARRLYDYRHLGRDPGVGPWVLIGEEVARGPDNEPVVRCINPIARLGAPLIDEATQVVEQFSGDWGPLDRTGSARIDAGGESSASYGRRE